VGWKMSYYTELWTKKESTGAMLHYERFWKGFKGKILDVGCSVGNFVAQDPKNITGIDIDKEAIEIAKKRSLNCLNADFFENGFEDKNFDGINAYAFIEHFSEPLKVMMEFKRLLKDNGRLVVITHSIRSIIHNRKSNFYDDYTHQKIFTKQSLKQLAMDSGFEIIEIGDCPPNTHGLGWLLRRGLSVEKILVLQDFMKRFSVSDNVYLIAKVRKPSTKSATNAESQQKR
jgi:2-polyprenyl-3-methyl-5-hydroxy-6-metoxy-1,4-benzoquinol methylase